MSKNLPADLGPYETEQQAIEVCREAYGHPHTPGHMGMVNRTRLTAACEAAGVELGTYDMRVLYWLARWEPEVCAVVAGIIARAGGVR